jgi:hypothetical protein
MKLAFLLALSLVAQSTASVDPVIALPDSYRLQFENEWVKVVKVTYAPHARLPAHAHTKWAAAYVYLNDSGPVVFRHVGKDDHSITRPPTKARSFRLHRAVDEEHEVDNLSELPSEFLRVEFKTDPKDPQTLRGRFYSEPDQTRERAEHLQFDNAQLRVTRLNLAPSRGVRVATSASEPALLIAVSPAHVAIANGNGSEPAVSMELLLGQEKWLDVNQYAEIQNRGSQVIEILRFDLKTAPVETTRAQ